MSSTALINWLLHMGIDVSVLIIFVLLVRKPIARFFGSGPTYYLWALPILGFLIPEIKLQAAAPELPSTIITTYSSFKQVAVIEPVATNISAVDFSIYVVFVWLSVAALWFAFQLIAYRSSYKRTILTSAPANAELENRVTSIAKNIRLQNIPRIRLCLEDGQPMVIGILKPVMVLPHSFKKQFSTAEQDMIMAHEMMHIKRKDLWLGLVLLVFRAVNWPNPLVHYAAYCFRIDQEAACDASVLKLTDSDRRSQQIYMQALLKTTHLENGV